MKLFISWSKEPSHQIALALCEWLPRVVPSVKPWISSEHIAKGARGREAIAEALAGTGEGVICLTKQNVREPWLNFEAGALSNHPSNPHVRTVLFDLKHSDVVGPLAEFQHTILDDRNDVLKLVQDIAAVSEPANIQPVVPTLFETFWPELDYTLARIRQESQTLPTDDDSALPRSPEELIEEVLERVRSLDINQRVLMKRSSKFDDLIKLSQASDSADGQFFAGLGMGVSRVISIDDDGVLAETIERFPQRWRTPPSLIPFPIRTNIAEAQQDDETIRLLVDTQQAMQSAQEDEADRPTQADGGHPTEIG